jgi:hypothetical protein
LLALPADSVLSLATAPVVLKYEVLCFEVSLGGSSGLDEYGIVPNMSVTTSRMDALVLEAGRLADLLSDLLDTENGEGTGTP